MRTHGVITLSTFLTLGLVCGCASSRSERIASNVDSAPTANAATNTEQQDDGESAVETSVRQVEFQETPEPTSEPAVVTREAQHVPLLLSTSLIELEQIAIEQNPRLTRLEQKFQAAAARSHHVDKLPDPKLGANVFGDPIETASGSQRANMNLSQTIPWLGKLNAKQQQASLEAFAIRAERDAERLNVLAAVRTGWYRLYVIDKQIETTIANQKLLKSLVDVANARIATGKASPGDVLLGTLELSQLEERLLTFRTLD
jgi:outer membrane protein TolC